MSIPSALQGKLVLIHFWADWCPVCLKELANSKELIDRFGPKGLTILAINLKQRPAAVAHWLEKLALNFPVVFDSNGFMAAAFGVTALPSSYLIDHQGLLQRRIIGELSPEKWEQVVKQML
jgi:peroxiredoxin